MTNKKTLSNWRISNDISSGEYEVLRVLASETNLDYKVDLNAEYELNELFTKLHNKWRNIELHFTLEQAREWAKRDFTYWTCKEWVDTGLNTDDYDFCRWLRDFKQITPEELVNWGDFETLKAEFDTWIVNNPFNPNQPPSTPAPTQPSTPQTQEQKLYQGLAKLYDEWIGLDKEKKKEDKDEAERLKKEEEKLEKDWENLLKHEIIYKTGGSVEKIIGGGFYKYGQSISKAPFLHGGEVEGFEKNPDGTDKLDNFGNLIPIYKPNIGKWITTFPQFKEWVEEVKELLRTQFGSPPHIALNGEEIWTYEQWKLIALRSRPTDYLTRSGKLTYLASFLEQFFKTEGTGPVRKSLIEMLSLVEPDFLTYQPTFWKKISPFVKITAPTPPPPPELPKEISDWLLRVRDYINFVFAPYEPHKSLLNPTLYYGEIEAIVNDLETLLTELWRRFLQNPNLFFLRMNSLLTTISNTRQFGENTTYNKGVTHDRLLQRTVEVSTMEQPLKTSQADNIKNWDRFKSQLFHNQSRDTQNEFLKFDNTSDKGGGQKRGNQQDVKSILREIDPRMESRLLETVARIVDRFVIYKDIIGKLKKHFFTLGEPLYHYAEVEEK